MTSKFSVDLFNLEQREADTRLLVLHGYMYSVSATVALRVGGTIAFAWEAADVAQLLDDLDNECYLPLSDGLMLDRVVGHAVGCLRVFLRTSEEEVALVEDVSNCDYANALATAKSKLNDFAMTLLPQDRPLTHV